MKIKKYWSGNVRIFLDSLICILISFIALILDGPDFTKKLALASILGWLLAKVIVFFFTFFFWSWKRDHVKCRFARTIIHTFFYSSIIPMVFTSISTLYEVYKQPNNIDNWLIFIIVSFLISLITIKYLNIMSYIGQNDSLFYTIKCMFLKINNQNIQANEKNII